MYIREFFLVLLCATCGWGRGLSCYSCSIKEKCFTLDTSNRAHWADCDPGTTHCIMERIVSAATGAVVENRMCGGQVYIDRNKPLDDGCYSIVRLEDSRVNNTRCYCSQDYCNVATARGVWSPWGLLAVVLATVGWGRIAGS